MEQNIYFKKLCLAKPDSGHSGMAGFGVVRAWIGLLRAELRALSQVHIGSSSLGAFIAANSCLMLMDDRSSTATRLRLICVRSGVGLSWCTGAF